MFSKIATDILKKTLGAETPEVIIANNALAFLEEFSFKKPLIVTDKNIFSATSECRGLNYDRYVFDKEVKPDLESINNILNNPKEADVLIAFGSGTINDIVKRVSYLSNKPYICVPTAPSMNGYGSKNASIFENGLKTSLAGALPIAIVADLNILANSPLRMIKSGLGDSMARLTAQADWLLSHKEKNTSYDERVYEMIYDVEEEVFKNAEQLLTRNLKTVAKLTELLILSGLGMTIAKSSAPYSGGEHSIAHAVEELYGNPGEAFHGEQISYTSQVMASIQEKYLLNDNLNVLRELATRAELPLNAKDLGWNEEFVAIAIKNDKCILRRYGYLSR